MMMGYSNALREYRTTSAAAGIDETSSPHELIAALYDGALERLGRVRSAIQRGDVKAKVDSVTSTLAILDHLRLSLDPQNGGVIAGRLEDLYDYMSRRLLEANLRNDVEAVEEVMKLLRSIKSGWDEIADA